jgi:hypothetical protein
VEAARLQLTGLETPANCGLEPQTLAPLNGSQAPCQTLGTPEAWSSPQVPGSWLKPSLHPTASSLQPTPGAHTPPSARLSSPTESPMRNLIQTQFGTCLHIDCVVIKCLHLRRGLATCISKLCSHSPCFWTVESGIRGDQHLAARRVVCHLPPEQQSYLFIFCHEC